MLPESPSENPVVAAAASPSQPEQPVPARGQKPWHRPTLTQVALQVTGAGSGQFQDGSLTSVG